MKVIYGRRYLENMTSKVWEFLIGGGGVNKELMKNIHNTNYAIIYKQLLTGTKCDYDCYTSSTRHISANSMLFDLVCDW